MRILYRVLLTLAAFVLVLPLAAQQFENLPQAKPDEPAPAGTIRIGIINIEGAMTQTQEGKKAAEDMQAQFGPRQSELQKLQEEIRNLESQLRTQERTLSNDARLQLARDIERKRKQFTRAQQDFQDEAQQAQDDHVARIGQKMRGVIERYAREKNLSIILNVTQGVVYAAPTVDITADIVQLYDQTYPVQSAAAPSGASPPPQPRN